MFSWLFFLLQMISIHTGEVVESRPEIRDQNLPWWQTTTIYQIYPRSYQDTDGDGIGDLAGIISRLDYIQDLGFETIWISPFYASPQADFGYDISDYYTIAPEYGDMALADSLIKEVHRRGMRIVFDMVLNHTSIEHEWFKQSVSDPDGTYGDWYIWADGNGKKPPNKWVNVFNKDAWHYIPERGQWYYTAFLESQPDLNWRNPEVKSAMFNMMKHWLDRGVDGFRLDIFNCILEKEDLENNPFTFKMLPSKDGMKGAWQKKVNNINYPDNFDLARQLRDTMDTYANPDRFLLGEAIGSLEKVYPLVGRDNSGLNLIFLFDMIFYDLKAGFFRKRIEEFNELFPYPNIPTTVFGNHDNFRNIRRVKGDMEKARLLALFQMTTRGVPVVYYGEEIGMLNAEISKKEALDPISEVFHGLPQFLRNILPVPVNRDVCRTPMQWDASENAGFTTIGMETWLPVSGEPEIRNVASQIDDPQSLLNTYRDLLRLRKDIPALNSGSIELDDKSLGGKKVLAFSREINDEYYLILINFSTKTRIFQIDSKPAEVIYKLRSEDSTTGNTVELAGLGGMILKMQGK